MGITGIGGYQQPYITPLSSGPAAAQRTDDKGPNERTETVEETNTRQQQAQQAQAQQAQGTQSQQPGGQPRSGGGYTTPTRGQNLNITA
ncbi:hypothetical protein [Azospirillum sp. sgz302134]